MLNDWAIQGISKKFAQSKLLTSDDHHFLFREREHGIFSKYNHYSYFSELRSEMKGVG